ncbi:MAG: sn-glycerol-1-phosphate dehydrogenase [Kiloniellales bacterium]
MNQGPVLTASDSIDRLIGGDYPDPAGGAPLGVPTRAVVIADSLAGAEDSLVSGLDLGARLAVVCDPTTRAVLGERVCRALASVAKLDSITLPERPHADMPMVDAIREASRCADALIAVGSGTINDLCKYAAYRDGKPYAVFATAPSMNGYTSVNAAITERGMKKSLPAVAPAGVFMDLTVLAAAPPRMIRSGLGDSLCRPTAQFDWLLAHLLFDQPYSELPFALLADDEPALFAEADSLIAGDLAAMARLARSLVLSGFGMTLCGGSYPASQGEHLISHTIDMLGRGLPESFHGEQIGVTTLTMARLHEELLDRRSLRVAASSVGRGRLLEHFGACLGEDCWTEFGRKRLDGAAAERLNDRLAGWPQIAERLASVALPANLLQGVLVRAGAPLGPEQLGWPDALYADAVAHARFIRNRYTALDLAGDAGLLDGFVARLYRSDPVTQQVAGNSG